MNVSLRDFVSFHSCLNFISNQFSALSLQQKVGLAALAILGSFTVYYFSCNRFEAQNLNDQKETLDDVTDLEEKREMETSSLIEQSRKVQTVSDIIQKKDEPLEVVDVQESLHSKSLFQQEPVLMNLTTLSDSSFLLKVYEEEEKLGKEQQEKKVDDAKQLMPQKEDIKPLSPVQTKTDEAKASKLQSEQDDGVISCSPLQEHVKPFQSHVLIHSQSLPILKSTKDKKEKNEVKEERKPRPVSLSISSGKAKAMAIYKKDPKQCGRIQKNILFKDIKAIETSVRFSGEINSVVDLMLYLSELSEVDLAHPLCAQVVIDTFKECDKETSERLCEWLGKQKTFNTNLLRESMTVLIDKYEKQIPLSLYSIEQLLKIYKEREWHQERNIEQKLILPIDQDVLVSSMAILIQNMPNEDRIIALAEWFMNQPEYNSQIFSRWVKIFQRKEQEKGLTIYYPLLNKMIVHFEQKWGPAQFKELEVSVVSYLLLRGLISSGS